MSRSVKIRLTPLQRDVLWMLEEAGSASLQLIRVTLTNAISEELQEAIQGLVDLGYVVQTDHRNEPEIVMTNEGRLALTR